MLSPGRAIVGLLLLALGGSQACAAPEDDASSGAAAIIHGSDSTSKQDAVVLLSRWTGDAPTSVCTGTLVAPNLVLTARHCVSKTFEAKGNCLRGKPVDGKGMLFESDFAAKDVGIFVGRDAAGRQGARVDADAWGKELVYEGESVCDDDVAFILLDRGVRGEVAPLRLESGPGKGEKITSVGWGLTETGELASRRKQRPDIPVVAVGADAYLGKKEFRVGEATCAGDSGGPALSSKGAVVGVVSRGGNGDDEARSAAARCVGKKVLNIYAQLAAHKPLVDRAFRLANAKPRLEGDGTGSAPGATCAKNHDCSSEACTANTCAPRCVTDADCLRGEACTPEDTSDGASVRVCVAGPRAGTTPAPSDDGGTRAPPAPDASTPDAGGPGPTPAAPSSGSDDQEPTGAPATADEGANRDSDADLPFEEASTSSKPSESAPGGCSTSPGEPSGAHLGMALAALALLGTARRRRRSPAPPT